MVRLVLTFILVLLLALYIAEEIYVKAEMAFYYNTGTEFYTNQYQGTFDLLDDAIAELEGIELNHALIVLKKRFSTNLHLTKTDDAGLPREGMAILDGGATYLHDLGSSSSLHRKSVLSGYVWSISISPTRAEKRIIELSGPLSLLKEQFSGTTAQSRPAVIKRLRRSYEIPLTTKSIDSIELSNKEAQRLSDEQIIVRNAYESGELFMVLLDDKQSVFQLGPINHPEDFEWGGWLFDGIFASFMLLGVLLWSWTLWRDLQRLRTASLAVGEGKLQTRVRSSLYSLIRPTMEGFNVMAARTENMVESQRELTNAVSHELRTPLARMMFDLQMAKDSENKNDQFRHFESLEHSVGELNTLVDELLTYARQERLDSPLELETLSIDEMQEWLQNQVSRAYRGRESAVKITTQFHSNNVCEHSVHFSPRLMAHALSNTLQNSLKFAREHIEVSLIERQGFWILSVEDDGMGIAEERWEHAFEPFSRLDESRHRDSGGFGLGLAIVRKIAQWHQGSARIAYSESLNGTRVEIQWPVTMEF